MGHLLLFFDLAFALENYLSDGKFFIHSAPTWLYRLSYCTCAENWRRKLRTRMKPKQTMQLSRATLQQQTRDILPTLCTTNFIVRTRPATVTGNGVMFSANNEHDMIKCSSIWSFCCVKSWSVLVRMTSLENTIVYKTLQAMNVSAECSSLWERRGTQN